MPSFKPTILVLALALLGVAAMAMVARRDVSRIPSTGQRQMLLDKQSLPVDDVSRITLTRADEPEFVFERTGAGWVQAKPFAHPMEAFSIRQLAQQALQLEVVDRLNAADLPESLSSSALMLDPPAAAVTYEWSGGNLTLNLGKSFLAGRAYMQIAGDDAIYVVNQSLHERAVNADPKEWRERAIFTDIGVESDRIERDDGGSAMVLVRDRKQWKMVEPVETRIDLSMRDAMMQELGRARVGGFILDQPTDLSRFGLSEPVASIAITTTRLREGNGDADDPDDAPKGLVEIQKLLIGSPVAVGSQDRFGLIEGRPVVVRVPASVLASLFRKPETIAAVTASGVVPADVKSILIRRGTEELRLVRDLERWRAPGNNDDSADPGTEVQTAQVNELLEQLTNLQAPDVQFKPYPHELEVATITLYGFDGKAMDTVRIAQEKDTGRWALENGDNVLRVFPTGLKLALTADDYGLR